MGLELLTEHQRALVLDQLPDVRVVADLSWGLVETTVLHVVSATHGTFVVKAGGLTDTHIARELRAHRTWTAVWTATGHAPTLRFGDAAAKLLITTYLPGHLVENTTAQFDPDTYRQAGRLLARFHEQHSVFDDSWNTNFRARVERHLGLPHKIDPWVERQVRAELEDWPDGGACVCPTHGDWQPRNWLIDEGTVRVIDFGRADLRPASEDFVRLARQDFDRNPELESAFLAGYGSDPREPHEWRRALVGEAVGTAVWAYGVGDIEFERFGHTLLARLFPSNS